MKPAALIGIAIAAAVENTALFVPAAVEALVGSEEENITFARFEAEQPVEDLVVEATTAVSAVRGGQPELDGLAQKAPAL